MAKKTPETASLVVVDGYAPTPANVGGSEIAATCDNVVASKTARDDLARRLGVDLSGTLEERADLAAAHMNRSQRYMLASGLVLQSMKEECQPGEFLELVQARGFGVRAGQRAMQYAQFVLSQPVDVQERLMAMPRSKVMLLAAADAEVIEVALEKGLDSINALSVRKLQEELADVKAQLTNESVRRETAETQAEGLQKKLDRRGDAREDQLPWGLADARFELMAQGDVMRIVLDRLEAQLSALAELELPPKAAPLADGTRRLALAQLCSLQVRLNGLIDAMAAEMNEPAMRQMNGSACLTKLEREQLAEKFQHELGYQAAKADRRALVRRAERQTGPGRPIKVGPEPTRDDDKPAKGRKGAK